MILIEKRGSINSSIEYNKENDGMAIVIKIRAGIMVQYCSNFS